MARKHLLAFTISGGWGHARPMLIWFSRLVKLHPVEITFLIPEPISERGAQEIQRHFAEDEQHLRDLVRLDIIPGASPARWDIMRKSFDDGYDAILADPSRRDPDLVVCDIVAHTVFESMQARVAAGAKKIPVVGWAGESPMVLLPMIREYCSDIPGLVKSIEDRASEQNILFKQASDQVNIEHIRGEPINIPELPPMADYELYPQEPPFYLTFEIHLAALRSIVVSDGFVTSACYGIEPKTHALMTDYFGDRPVSYFGPLAPPPQEEELNRKELTQTAEWTEVEIFMKRVLKERGEKSLLYISFGSSFSTQIGYEADKIWAWLEVTADLDVPTLVSYPARNHPVPEPLRSRLDASPYHLLLDFTPQQYILAHQATGWFLTHNGMSSTHESLAAGIPTISWPLCSDQPVLSTLCSQVIECGYELNEVRRGWGLKPRLSTGFAATGTVDATKREAREVLSKAFGDDVAAKARIQAGVERGKTLMADAWTEGGYARRECQRFIDRFLL
ncbi:unnamed protein product [Peniophora sp. CBMAI 1063]|nr:unnamed protein product [Peniophora sp. CBMAI 1063]